MSWLWPSTRAHTVFGASDRKIVKQTISISGTSKTGVAFAGYDKAAGGWLGGNGDLVFHNTTKTLHVTGATNSATRNLDVYIETIPSENPTKNP